MWWGIGHVFALNWVLLDSNEYISPRFPSVWMMQKRKWCRTRGFQIFQTWFELLDFDQAVVMSPPQLFDLHFDYCGFSGVGCQDGAWRGNAECIAGVTPPLIATPTIHTHTHWQAPTHTHTHTGFLSVPQRMERGAGREDFPGDPVEEWHLEPGPQILLQLQTKHKQRRERGFVSTHRSTKLLPHLVNCPFRHQRNMQARRVMPERHNEKLMLIIQISLFVNCI